MTTVPDDPRPARSDQDATRRGATNTWKPPVCGYEMTTPVRLEPPAFFVDVATRREYEDRVALRSIYALVPHGRRRDNAAVDVQCPAQAGKLRCHLVASSMRRPVTILPALAAPRAVDGRDVCSNRYTRIDAADLPLHQRDLFGSTEWHHSYARRGPVEGFFGNLKNMRPSRSSAASSGWSVSTRRD